MKKQAEKNKKRIFTAAVIFALVSLICGIAVSAAYINLNTVKRVVSTQGAGGTPFSSNYLLLVPRDTTSYAIKNINCPEGAGSAQFEINVCNYVQNDPSKISENDIKYSLTLTQLNNDGTVNTESFSGLKVTDASGASFTFTDGVCCISDQLLPGNVKTVNTYYVSVPKEMVNNVDLRAEAEPSDSSSYSVTNGNKLARNFVFTEYNALSSSWTGGFKETSAENNDAFNYVIRGQGKGTVTLSWDSDQLEISGVFLDNYALRDKVTSEGNRRSLTIDVDSNNGPNRYDIQFYKTKNGVYTNMTAVNGYVTVSFSESVS